MAGKRKNPPAGKAPAKRETRTDARQARAGRGASAEAMPAGPAGETAERGLSDVDRMLLTMGALPAAPDGDAAGEGTESSAVVLPEIDPLATFWTELDLFCRDCGITHYVNFCTLLNAEESPHLVERARANQMNYKRCPMCKQIEYVQHPWTFFDPRRNLVVQIRPEWEWHAGGGEEWYAARLEDLFDRWSEHDVQLDVVFGPTAFIEKYLSNDQAGCTSNGQPAG